MSFHGFQGMPQGSSSLARGHKPMSDINVTPFVDVMLVLLVVFLVTAPWMASAIRLDLPASAAAQPVASVGPSVTVVLGASGGVWWDDRPVSDDALLARLREQARLNPETEVQLRADASAPYGRVVQVIGLAQQAGLNRVGFVADPASPVAQP